MSIKKKYSKIDQSKLPKSIVDVLKGIERKTDNFTDKKANKIFEPQLNNLIKGLKAKHPQSITSKPVAKNNDEFMSFEEYLKNARFYKSGGIKSAELYNGRKVILKADSTPDNFREDLRDFLKRAYDRQKAEFESNKESSKPNEKIEAALKDVKKTIKSSSSRSIERDSKRKALPAGKRISREGNVYYEYRDNRSDRNAPNFPKNKPYLKGGGETDTIASVIFYANSKNGKIKTDFGDKTLIGFRQMLLDDDYDTKELAGAIFKPNQKSNRISTGWGTKTLSGLETMIKKARA